MRRRGFLRVCFGTLGAVLSGSGAVALAQSSAPVAFARLKIPGLSDPRPGALGQLVREVENNSSVVLEAEVTELAPDSPLLFDHPFVVLSGDRAFAALSDSAVSNLRLYLREGGFLFVDDASGLEDSDFDRAFRREMKRILPGSSLRPIGRDHVIYRSFFLLRGISGRMRVQDHLEGVWVGDITPVLYSQNDLLGSLQRAPGGSWALDVVPGGDRQRVEARKLAINLALFALTGNYKLDVVHVETLLDRMRRQGGYGR